MTKEATRIKLGYVVIAVTFVEGVITTFWPGFPFAAAAGIQAGVYATYVTGRTVTDAKWKDSSVTVTHEGGASEEE
jgi:hypothetical protein